MMKRNCKKNDEQGGGKRAEVTGEIRGEEEEEEREKISGRQREGTLEIQKTPLVRECWCIISHGAMVQPTLSCSQKKRRLDSQMTLELFVHILQAGSPFECEQ